MDKPLYSTSDWSLHLISITDFHKLSLQIDCDPIGQRPSVEPNDNGGSKPSKSQGIINAIFEDNDLGEIKIVRNLMGEPWPYESLDGGHRKRAILRFLKGFFRTHKSLNKIIPGAGGKLFSELSAELQEKFLNYTIRMVVYRTMSNEEKGKFFRQSNYSTSVNHQEMLNSYGNIPIANYLRNTVRIVPRLNNETHDLFYYNINTNGEANYKYLSFANRRLDHDERVARIAYMMYKGEVLTICDKAELEEMYADQSLNDADNMKRLAKKVNACLDFLLSIAIVRKRLKKNTGLSQTEFTMLYRLYVYFKQQYGDFKLVDAETFYKSFDLAMLKFVGRDEKKLIKNMVHDDKEPRMMFEAFKGYLTVHTSLRKIVSTCKWLIEDAGFDPVANGSIIIRHTKRVFSKADIEAKLAEQNYTCWVTGKKLTMNDAQGAHVVPHSAGGATEYGNLVVVSAEHNRKMGEMNAYDYKDLYQRQVKKAA